MSRDVTETLVSHTLRDNEQTQREVLEVNAAHWEDVFSNSKYIIPEYQRDYSWEESQQNDFLDTIFDAFDDVRPFPDEDSYELPSPAGAYLGTAYFAKNEDGDSNQTTFEIVDGQQRLATVQIILSVLFDFLQYYHQGEGSNEVSVSVYEDLALAKTHLTNAFDSEGNPSVTLGSKDNDYFKALTAKAERGHRDPERIRFIGHRLDFNDDINGQHKPRAIQIKELLEVFEDYQKYFPNSDSIENQLVRKLNSTDLSESDGELTNPEAEDGSAEEEETPLFSQRDVYIRYETSHEKLVEMHKRVFKRVEEEISELEADEAAYYIANLAEFTLKAMTISRCSIESPDSKLNMDIFKSINDKGKPLHGIDLIRARIRHSMAGSSTSTLITDFNKMLTKFGGEKKEVKNMLEYYIAVDEASLNTKSEAREGLLDYFSRRNNNPSVDPRLSGNDEEIEEKIREILGYADFYYSMVDGDGERFNELDGSISNADKQDLRTTLSRIENQIGATQYRSLGAYACWVTANESRLDREKAGNFLKKVFDAIEILTLRQSISDKSGQAIEGVYVETAGQLKTRLERLEDGEISIDEAFDGDEVINDIRTNGEDKEGSLFENGMVRAVVANTNWSNSQVKAVFHRMTQLHLRSGEIELELRNVDDLHIEHILPQSPISDRGGRSEQSGKISKYAWLEYFFKTENDDSNISSAVEQLFNLEIDSLSADEIEDLDLEDSRVESDFKETIGQIEKRFINDIGNRIFLHSIDDSTIQNRLFSKKLKIYLRDDYLNLPTNQFISSEEDEFNLFNHLSGVSPDDLDEDSIGSIDNDTWEVIDKGWTFDVLFNRKEALIPDILKALTFQTDTDEFRSDTIDEAISEEISKDKQYRLDQSSF